MDAFMLAFRVDWYMNGVWEMKKVDALTTVE
jgi:hypothetical protein